ncbi:MAG: methylcobamide--CoM methyltransferase [Clostridiales Family XIII bacterium]|jgi:[methyl-Co(III) methanol-specific corrinoid protein]:coenzyme M methyltransferase|nr:methylcobamide--CoM methyltransferase [Clostridiales Family XIII bacterium]
MSDVFSPKERLIRTLAGEKVERPPVICPGGMMNAALVDVMTQTGHLLPAAHKDAALMSALSADVAQLTGFENIGIPFCMTVEAEALGSEINFGTLECEPKIEREVFPDVLAVDYLPIGAVANAPRTGVLIDAIQTVSKQYEDIPVIGSLTGPVSTAASIVDPMTFLKQLRKNRDDAHRVMAYVTEQLIDYAKILADNGAAVISIADPTATGEILGPKLFTEFALPYLNHLIEEIHAIHVPVIVHICGDVNMIKPQLAQLKSNAISVDAMVNLQKLKQELGGVTVMGNVSTYQLEFGEADAVSKSAERLMSRGIDIIAPACGLSTSTPLANIEALTGTVKEGI